jgi:hypothetical protein
VILVADAVFPNPASATRITEPSCKAP